MADLEEFFKEQIKPYEERIKKLEELDKKKDVEITLVKEIKDLENAENKEDKKDTKEKENKDLIEKNKLITPSKGGVKKPVGKK